jgi:hypothetical protein
MEILNKSINVIPSGVIIPGGNYYGVEESFALPETPKIPRFRISTFRPE